jgi:hypothetical protein
MKNRLGFRPSSSYPSHLWGRDERSSPFLSLPLVGSRRAKLALGWHIVSAANRCVGWGCFREGGTGAFACAAPTRRFAPPSPQGGGMKSEPALPYRSPRGVETSGRASRLFLIPVGRVAHRERSKTMCRVGVFPRA